MRFLLTICASAFLLAAGSGLALAQGKNATPKQQAKQKWAGGTLRPSQQVELLLQMPPEQREQYLSRLPAKQRDQLERLASLPPERRARQLKLLDMMESLPQERRQAVRQEITRIAAMRFVQRRARLHSRDFEQSFSAPEQELIRARFPNAVN